MKTETKTIIIICFFQFLMSIAYSQDVSIKCENGFVEMFSKIERVYGETLDEDIEASSEEEFILKYHSNIGMKIRNQFRLWKKRSKLKKCFNNLGLFIPDDISAFVLAIYYKKYIERLEINKNNLIFVSKNFKYKSHN